MHNIKIHDVSVAIVSVITEF